jgi:hypothetical protein
MPGTFKKLDASDIKITPFEAHKQYSTDTDLSSIGAQTASLNWSGLNKSTFTTGSRQYYQIDKLYYRNYIQERANLLELNDANYTTQERRLYESASLLSLSQKTFGSEIQPESFNLSVTKDGITYNITDDGFGNLYDVTIGKENFPNEDQRVLYLAPVQAFKRENLTLNIENGNELVNAPTSYNNTVYDDSYFQNTVTYYKNKFNREHFNTPSITQGANNDARVTIQNAPHLNFNSEDFCISFYYKPGTDFNSLTLAGATEFILTKEGAQDSPPLGSEAGGGFSTDVTGALDFTTTPAPPQFPYRLSIKSVPGTGSLVFERFDGENRSFVSGNIFHTSDNGLPIHVVAQRANGKLQIYKNGIIAVDGNGNMASKIDTATGICQNKSNITLFKKQNPNGTYNTSVASFNSTSGFSPQQLQIWNQGMSSAQIAQISESFTGTYPVGNIFYDNGFAVLTHPKYMELFNGGTLDSLSYKNTHLITEYEYQCTMNENEFEFTNNQSVRKKGNIESEELATFALNDDFKPYVTTVGLYDDDYNLLVVGKLGQPIKASSETDTTFVIRFDT